MQHFQPGWQGFDGTLCTLGLPSCCPQSSLRCGILPSPLCSGGQYPIHTHPSIHLVINLQLDRFSFSQKTLVLSDRDHSGRVGGHFAAASRSVFSSARTWEKNNDIITCSFLDF
jgi:hypothetical protein